MKEIEEKMQTVEQRVKVLKRETDKLYYLVVKKAVNPERELTCHKCSWNWSTKSSARQLTCPGCGIKVENIHAKNEK